MEIKTDYESTTVLTVGDDLDEDSVLCFGVGLYEEDGAWAYLTKNEITDLQEHLKNIMDRHP